MHGRSTIGDLNYFAKNTPCRVTSSSGKHIHDDKNPDTRKTIKRTHLYVISLVLRSGLWLERRTLVQENLGFNHIAVVS